MAEHPVQEASKTTGWAPLVPRRRFPSQRERYEPGDSGTLGPGHHPVSGPAQPDSRKESKCALASGPLQTPSKDARRLVTPGSTGKARTSASLTEQEQQMNKVDELTLQLQMMTNERNELRAILANYTNNDMNNRLNSELEELKMDHQKEMSELEKFPKEISEASSKCKELTETTNSYSRLLRERTQMKEKVAMLREDNRKLQQEQIFLQESCEETKRLCEEALEKIGDLLTKQQQEHQRLEKHLRLLRKQKELGTQLRDLAGKQQHHFTESQTRFEHLQHELEQTTAQRDLFYFFSDRTRKRPEKLVGNQTP
ncbi:hypothetical protein ACRRTK_022999 [Alexandromys fortis]